MGRSRSGKRYSAEFKREALKRASEDGITDKVVCEELGISTRQLGRWRDELRLLGDNAFMGKGVRNAAEEVIRLKRELAKVRQERDYFDKVRALAIKHRAKNPVIRKSCLDCTL